MNAHVWASTPLEHRTILLEMKSLQEVVIVIDMSEDSLSNERFSPMNGWDNLVRSNVERQIQRLVQDNPGWKYPRFTALENEGERVSIFDEVVAGAWDDVWVRTLNSRQYFERALKIGQLFN